MNENLTLPKETGLQCPMCEAHRVTTQYENEEFSFGSGDNEVLLKAYIPINHCTECGYEFLGEKADAIRHHAICQYLGLLTPSEIKEIRIRLGRSQKAFAELTGLGEATVQRWEQGQKLQSASYDIFLRFLCFPDNVERLQKHKQGQPMAQIEVQSKEFKGRALDENSIQNLNRSREQFVLNRKTG